MKTIMKMTPKMMTTAGYKICGLDIGTRHAAACLISYENEKYIINDIQFFKFNNKDSIQRIIEMARAIIKYLKMAGPSIIIMEEYFGHGKGRNYIPYLQGILFYNYPAKYILVPTNTIKKLVVGNGRAAKDDIKKFIIDNIKKGLIIDGPSKITENMAQDIYDSIMIAIYGAKKILGH